MNTEKITLIAIKILY